MNTAVNFLPMSMIKKQSNGRSSEILTSCVVFFGTRTVERAAAAADSGRTGEQGDAPSH